jgi:rhodanese-related sulfurtransferase
MKPFYLALIAGLAAAPLSHQTWAAENRIAPNLDSVQTIDKGKPITIQRGHNPEAHLPEAYSKTDRGCPPFCVQPMVLAPGVETIGELDVLDYLKRIGQGDKTILVVDSRTPDWVMRGTIPGSVNIPWNRINVDTGGTFETPGEAEGLVDIMTKELGAKQTPDGKWDYTDAKTLVLFCNGIWCPQSSANIKTLLRYGYPASKLKWYRGGMQDWLTVGLTTVKP